MQAIWRPLPAWPYAEGRRLAGDRFRSGWEGALALLEAEIERLKGDEVVLGVVVDAGAIGFSGQLKAGSRTRFGHRGVEVSFELPRRGRVVFHTDAYDTVTANLRAVGLGLEALRAVDRHGVTTAGEQYAGFALLGPGPAALPAGVYRRGSAAELERGRQLVAAAGSIEAALMANHPDHGGRPVDLQAVLAFRDRGKVPA